MQGFWSKRATESAPVGACQRDRLISQATLNQATPLHVVEEESLAFVGVIELSEADRAAHVEAVSMEPQLGNFVRGGIEVVAGIEGIVAQELPRRSVEFSRSALDDRSHGRRRRQAIFGAVVGSHFAELGDGVHRRHDGRPAGAAAVVTLGTIEQIKVVAFTHAVKADIGVAADWRGTLKIPLAAGRSGRQGDQRVHAAPVGRELCDLLAGDHVAEFAGVRLHGDGCRFHGDLLRGAANLQFQVDAGAIIDGEHDILLLGTFKTRRCGVHSVVADLQGWCDILAVGAARQIARNTGVGVGDGDGGIGNGRARGVGYSTDDSRFLCEGGSGEQHTDRC